jgi:hypothetical protein
VTPAGTYNVVADQGKTFQRRLVYGTRAGGVFTPFSNAGYGARMQVREKVFSSTPVLNLSTSTGEIVLGGLDGSIEITVDAVTMEGLAGTYVYDLELVSSSPTPVVLGVVRGTFSVRPEVTR